jgi:hypothetical protein
MCLISSISDVLEATSGTIYVYGKMLLCIFSRLTGKSLDIQEQPVSRGPVPKRSVKPNEYNGSEL